MNTVSFKPQMNVMKGQSELASSLVSSQKAGANEKSQSFDNVLKDKQTPPVSKDSSTLDKNLKVKNEIVDKSRPAQANSEAPVQSQERLKSKVDSNDVTSSQTEQQAREKIMNHFLQKLQAELGVTPEQFVEAFSKLEVTDLALPAENTIEKVIAHLNLNESQKEVAEGLYSEMLVLTAAVNMSQYLQKSEKTAQVEVLTPEQAAKKQLNKNISEMSTQFFNGPKPAEVEATQKATQKALGQQTYSALYRQGKVGAESAMAQKPAAHSMSEAVQSAPQFSESIDFSALGLEPTENLDPQTEEMIQNLQQKMSEMTVQAPDAAEASNLTVDGADDINQLFSKSTSTADMTTVPSLNSSAPLAGLGEASDGQESLSQDSSSSFDQNLVAGQDRVQNQKIESSQFVVQAPKPTGTEVQNNIQELISQAQFLAQKGGGEMKVQMTPEGMGQINLKVSVVEGQVNVEMVASNGEAKKLLEKGMDELKANLASQKLNVDQIKIESSSEASNQMNRQPGQESAERQFQQRFLQDFRDNNNGFRRSFFDVGSPRVPGSQLSDRNDNTTYDPTARKKAAARRLDLVA